ncbi:MAG: hypothetical protein IKN66_00755 [Ruminococcus sp.]|nr:hypothetical protein [Ruminococcus sp.]
MKEKIKNDEYGPGTYHNSDRRAVRRRQDHAVLGHYLFGYNKKTHIIHLICFLPAAALLAWICTLL